MARSMTMAELQAYMDAGNPMPAEGVWLTDQPSYPNGVLIGASGGTGVGGGFGLQAGNTAAGYTDNRTGGLGSVNAPVTAPAKTTLRLQGTASGDGYVSPLGTPDLALAKNMDIGTILHTWTPSDLLHLPNDILVQFPNDQLLKLAQFTGAPGAFLAKLPNERLIGSGAYKGAGFGTNVLSLLPSATQKSFPSDVQATLNPAQAANNPTAAWQAIGTGNAPATAASAIGGNTPSSSGPYDAFQSAYTKAFGHPISQDDLNSNEYLSKLDLGLIAALPNDRLAGFSTGILGQLPNSRLQPLIASNPSIIHDFSTERLGTMGTDFAQSMLLPYLDKNDPITAQNLRNTYQKAGQPVAPAGAPPAPPAAPGPLGPAPIAGAPPPPSPPPLGGTPTYHPNQITADALHNPLLLYLQMTGQAPQGSSLQGVPPPSGSLSGASRYGTSHLLGVANPYPYAGNFAQTDSVGSVDPGVRQNPHTGNDYAFPANTPVPVAENGTVIYAGNAGDFGLTVVVAHQDGTQTQYSHLNKLGVQPGDTLNAGQPLGLSGSTGVGTGPHLHYESNPIGSGIGVKPDGSSAYPLPDDAKKVLAEGGGFDVPGGTGPAWPGPIPPGGAGPIQPPAGPGPDSGPDTGGGASGGQAIPGAPPGFIIWRTPAKDIAGNIIPGQFNDQLVQDPRGVTNPSPNPWATVPGYGDAQVALINAQAALVTAQAAGDPVKIQQAQTALDQAQQQIDNTAINQQGQLGVAQGQLAVAQGGLALQQGEAVGNVGGSPTLAYQQWLSQQTGLIGGAPTQAALQQQAAQAYQAAQVALQQGNQEEAKRQFNLSHDLQVQAQNFTQGITESGVTGTYNGQDTQASLKQKADIAYQQGQLALQQGNADEAKRQFDISSGLQEQAQQFGQGVTAAGLTGTYDGQQTQAAIKQQADLAYQQGQLALQQGNAAEAKRQFDISSQLQDKIQSGNLAISQGQFDLQRQQQEFQQARDPASFVAKTFALRGQTPAVAPAGQYGVATAQAAPSGSPTLQAVPDQSAQSQYGPAPMAAPSGALSSGELLNSPYTPPAVKAIFSGQGITPGVNSPVTVASSQEYNNLTGTEQQALGAAVQAAGMDQADYLDLSRKLSQTGGVPQTRYGAAPIRYAA